MARKLALLIVSVAAALAMGFWLAPKLRDKLHPDPNVIRLLPGETADQSELERAEMLERLKWLEEQYPSIPIQAFDDTTLIRAQIQRPIMDRLYASVRIGDMAYHPVLNFRRRPNQNERYNWPEHPRGFWRVQTNSEGLRMNAERGPGPYLVIAGDSHMEGAASNEESAAGLMQAALDSERPDLQVVNMACGGYSFPQYLAAVEYLCQDRPGERVDPKRPIPIEALVVVVYGGNDFTEGCASRTIGIRPFGPRAGASTRQNSTRGARRIPTRLPKASTACCTFANRQASATSLFRTDWTRLKSSNATRPGGGFACSSPTCPRSLKSSWRPMRSRSIPCSTISKSARPTSRPRAPSPIAFSPKPRP